MGRGISLYYVHAGETCLLNLTSVSSDIPCPANAIVEQPVEALAFPDAVFRRWVSRQEQLRSFVYGTIAGGIILDKDPILRTLAASD